MDVLISSAELSDVEITPDNINNLAEGFINKLKNLEYISSNCVNTNGVVLYSSRLIYESNFLSDNYNLSELIPRIMDEDVRRRFLSRFQRFDGFNIIPDENYTSCKVKDIGDIMGLDYFISSVAHPMVLSFSLNEKEISECFCFSESMVVNIPSFKLKDDISNLPKILNFFSFSHRVFSAKSQGFDWFENYDFFHDFMHGSEGSYDKISNYLVTNQGEVIKYNEMIGDCFAHVNNYLFNKALTDKVNKKVKRKLYVNGKKIISLDFRHLEFEKHTVSGKHLGAVSMFKKEIKEAKPDHDLKGL